MAEGPDLRPSWFARVVGNRMAVLLNPTVRVLSVRGRTSGRWRSVAVVVLEHAGQRYLLAPSGNTDWSQTCEHRAPDACGIVAGRRSSAPSRSRCSSVKR